MTVESANAPPTPTSDPAEGRNKGQARGEEGAESEDEHERCDGDADDLADADELGDLKHRRRGKHLDRLPVHGGRCELDGVRHGALGQLERLRVEHELEQRRLAVRGDHRAGHRLLVDDQRPRCRVVGRLRSVDLRNRTCRLQQGAAWPLGDLLGHDLASVDDVLGRGDLVDRIQQRVEVLTLVDPLAVGRVEGDDALPARRVRQSQRELVDDLLGRSAVDSDVIAQPQRVGRYEPDDHTGDQYPGADDVPRLGMGELSPLIQQRRHGVLLVRRPPGTCTGSAASLATASSS